jgi:uncharacterized protein
MLSFYRSYKLFYLVILFALFTYSLPAQEYKKIPGDTVLEKALLWKITRPDLINPSYLFGTSHMLCTYYVDTALVLVNALRSCKSLVIEITDTQSVAIPYTTPIKELVGKWYFREIKKAIATVYPAEPDTGEKYKLPPLAYVNLMVGGDLSCSIISFEEVLASIARRNNMPVNGLETWTDRKDLLKLEPLTLKQQAWRLEDFIDDRQRFMSFFKKFIGYYKEHDITNLYVIGSFLPRRMPERSGLSKTMGDKRNILWLPRMETMMKNEPIFFAIGCAHLAGGYGLISLLRQKGYTVTPLF